MHEKDDNTRPELSTKIERLLMAKKELVENGKLNVTRAAEKIGMQQTTLQRIINGEIESPRTATLDKILNFLQITRGELFHEPHAKSKDSDDLDILYKKIANLPPDIREEVENFVAYAESKVDQ